MKRLICFGAEIYDFQSNMSQANIILLMNSRRVGASVREALIHGLQVSIPLFCRKIDQAVNAAHTLGLRR